MGGYHWTNVDWQPVVSNDEPPLLQTVLVAVWDNEDGAFYPDFAHRYLLDPETWCSEAGTFISGKVMYWAQMVNLPQKPTDAE